MNNLIRILLLLIYPTIIAVLAVVIWKKYKTTIKSNYVTIIMNALATSVIIAAGLIIFFHFEDTIYAYDYAGHWIRSLTLRKFFYEDPSKIISVVYNSMNYNDYSYLPALAGLLFVVIKQSYTFFALTNLLIFLIPAFIVIEICYYTYSKKNKYVPLIIFICIYPVYLTLFYGKVDCCGMLFIAIAYALIIMPDFKDISLIDNLAVNLCSFMAIFLRRWYLYAVVTLYISYFIKWLFYKNKKTTDLTKMVSSGIVALAIAFLFFRPFIINTLTNNFDEAYAFYNRDGKLWSLVNYISPLICLLCIIGASKLFIEKKDLLLINLVSIILPCAMIWRIQSFEFHHYYIFMINIIILVMTGFDTLIKRKFILVPVILVLLIQVGQIFTYSINVPFFTDIKKTPEVLDNKEALIDLSQYIKTIEPDDNFTAFLASGTYGVITDDLLRNALLPDIDFPNIDSAVFDIRDGLPHNLEYIKYIIVTDPTLYSDREFQHMFDVIKNAVSENELVSGIYEPIYSSAINDNCNVTIYERIGDFTPEIKKYFYNEMLKYYPDKSDYFSYILY